MAAALSGMCTMSSITCTSSNSGRISPYLDFAKRYREHCARAIPLSTPLALQREPGPEIRRLPLGIFRQRDLRGAQRRRRAQAILEHLAIEPGHQFRRSEVIERPQADNHARRAGVHKTTCQPDQSLAPDFLAQTSLAGAERNQLGREFQVEDFVSAQEPVLSRPLFVNQ